MEDPSRDTWADEAPVKDWVIGEGRGLRPGCHTHSCPIPGSPQLCAHLCRGRGI